MGTMPFSQDRDSQEEEKNIPTFEETAKQYDKAYYEPPADYDLDTSEDEDDTYETIERLQALQKTGMKYKFVYY